MSKATLRAFWQRHPQSRGPLQAWFADVRQATWDLIVHIAYRFKRVLVKFVGTHAEHDRIDPETIR
jgi:mRNA interferase HigB